MFRIIPMFTLLTLLILLTACQTADVPSTVTADTIGPATVPPAAQTASPTDTENTATARPAPTDTPFPSATATNEPATTAAAETATPSTIPAGDSLFTLASPDPVIKAGDGGSAYQKLHNPGAVIYHDGLFHMFRNGYTSLPGEAVIGYGTSPDGINWTFEEAEPVFSTADVPYAEIMIMASSVIVQEDGTWVLYFLIWDTETTPGAIGRATAPAPAGTWTPDPAPVLSAGAPGSWDAAQVTQPSVLPDETGDGYWMYYTGVDEEGVERVGLATSTDGIAWTRYDDPETTDQPFSESDPVLDIGRRGEWDAQGVARGRVVRAAEGYAMMYRTPGIGQGFEYGLAASIDGVHWSKYRDNPIVERADFAGNPALFFPTFAYHDGTYYFFIEAYAGNSRIFLLTRPEPLDMTGITGREDRFTVGSLAAIDVRNENNAADIQVQFAGAYAGSVTGYRLILVKADNAGSFTPEAAQTLPAGRYLALPPVTGTYRHTLPADLTDSDGDAVMEGVPYILFVLSENGADSSLARTGEPLTLANVAAVHTLVADLPSATGGIDVDQEGNIYVANIGLAPGRNGEDIYRITPDGQVSLWVSGQGLLGASGNTFDAAGNLIQSSLSANVIHRISPAGEVTEYAREGIRGPVGVVFAPDGTLFVANCRGDSIQQVDPDGGSTTLALDPLLNCPNGITMDEEGTLYVANFTGGGVLKVTGDGTVTPLAEVPGGNNGHLIYWNGLLYVVSRGNHQIYTLTLEGELTLLAGSGERGHRDGPALQATFSLPNDIIISPDGRRFYINEAAETVGLANTPSYIRVIELPREE